MKDAVNTNLENLYDVVIVGGGPAGLTAAIYLSRAEYRVLVLEKDRFGGQITITEEVVNYPGIKSIGGKELTEVMKEQAESFGAEFLTAEAIGLEASDTVKTVHTNRGDFNCLSVLIATGAHPRTVGFKGEEEYKGRGVAYCATCDGEFFTGKKIFVIGGGYAAAEESVFLTKFATDITILMRGDGFSCAASVAQEAINNKKITVITNVSVEEVSGENGLNHIRWKNTKTGETTEYTAEPNDSFGVFVFAGYSPDTDLVKGVAELNEQGYIVTDSSQRTSADGVFAAGDVCIKPLRQVVTATGDGALAATQAEKYVAEMQRKTGLRPKKPKRKESNEQKSEIGAQNFSEHRNFFNTETAEQLKNLFSEFEKQITLKLHLDSRPVSAEAEKFASALSELSDKVAFEVAERNSDSEYAPCIEVYSEGNKPTGLAFHGVPGGHEFTSFVLGLYNAAGEGQKTDESVKNEIKNITEKVDMKILVTLSCGMCPDLVTACQYIASKNKNVTAEVYDISHFEKLRQKYNVMSVPCLVINNDRVTFGKKSLGEVLDLIKKLNFNI